LSPARRHDASESVDDGGNNDDDDDGVTAALR
jgi:hypothetical protein